MTSGDSRKNDLNDFLSTVKLEELIQLKIDLQDALEDLGFVEKVVLLHHFWNNKTLGEVASILNKDENATKQIEFRALEKLRVSLNAYFDSSKPKEGE